MKQAGQQVIQPSGSETNAVFIQTLSSRDYLIPDTPTQGKFEVHDGCLTFVTGTARLRAAIREHRDGSGHDLCWHQPKLWSLLPEKTDPRIEVPEWPQFMRGCIAYRKSLDEQATDAPRTTVEFE